MGIGEPVCESSIRRPAFFYFFKNGSALCFIPGICVGENGLFHVYYFFHCPKLAASGKKKVQLVEGFVFLLNTAYIYERNQLLMNPETMNTIKHHANFLLLFCCMLTLPFIAGAQARDKKQTVDLLCHGWESDFTKSPKKMDCFPPDAGSSIRFLTNGYVVFDEKKGAEGVWNYDATVITFILLLMARSLNTAYVPSLLLNWWFESTANKNTTVYYLGRSKD